MLVSGAFLIGCLVSGIVLYILDCAFIACFNNLYLGLAVYFVLAIGSIILIAVKCPLSPWEDWLRLMEDRWAAQFLALFLAFSAWLNYHTFNASGGIINVVGGAWSDIMFHHAFARSVSVGCNIPVQYIYHPNSPMKYHFLYDYYVGKLSQMGLYSVHALNIMSILSLAFLLLLIFEFGRKFFKSTGAGILGALFLLFHSSLSGITWLFSHFGPNLPGDLYNKVGWVQSTEFEQWGLFNMNVFINQRHFAFTLALMVFIVNYMVSIKDDPGYSAYRTALWGIPFGVLAGCMPYWNFVIAPVTIVFIGLFALTCIKNKPVFLTLITSFATAAFIALPQIIFFKSSNSGLAQFPRLHLGYELQVFTIPAFFLYYFKVIGTKLVVLLCVGFIIPRGKRLIFLILSAPLLIANVVQLSPVLYDNNKLMFTSLIFLNCFSAYAVVWLFKRRPYPVRAVSVLLCISLMLGGVLDMMTVKNLKTEAISDSSPTEKWLLKNTPPGSIFLGPPDTPYRDNIVAAILLSGRKMYINNGCFPAYDPKDRVSTLKLILGPKMGNEDVKKLMKNEKIDYIVINQDMRKNKDLPINEDFFRNNFKCPYNDGNIAIYAP